MRLHANRDAPKRLGEHVLEAIASGDEVNVLYIALRELGAAGHGYLSAEKIEMMLESSTRIPRSIVFYMPSGDLFMLADQYPAEALRQITHLIGANLAKQASGNDVSELCQIYEVPEDAIPLRKLIKYYLADGTPPDGLPSGAAGKGIREVPAEPEGEAGGDGPGEAERSPPKPAPATSGGTFGQREPPPPPSQPRQHDAPAADHQPVHEAAAAHLEGPLTLDLLRELQQALDRIDVTPFIHQQPVYGREGNWHVRYVEHFFDLTRLSEAHFPKVDLRSNESLFVQFTRNLDDLMLIQILSQRTARHGRIGINLTVGTLRSQAFAKITEHLSADERRNIVCELHWIEFLQDIQDGGGAIQRLSELEYRLALDRVSAAVLPYLRLSGDWMDFIKVPFDRATMARIGPDAITALRECDARKLVLTSCDDAKALALGDALGIHNFQGRLIDQTVNRAA